MQQPDLPFDAGIITMALTNSQRRQLEPLVRRQVQDRRGLLLVSVAPDLREGCTVFRLQAKFLDWKRANKILRIIREGESEPK